MHTFIKPVVQPTVEIVIQWFLLTFRTCTNSPAWGSTMNFCVSDGWEAVIKSSFRHMKCEFPSCLHLNECHPPRSSTWEQVGMWLLAWTLTSQLHLTCLPHSLCTGDQDGILLHPAYSLSCMDSSSWHFTFCGIDRLASVGSTGTFRGLAW